MNIFFAPPERFNGGASSLFFPRPKAPDLIDQLRIPINSIVLSFPGDVNEGNARDVRSLYLAVAMLNREGVPVTLVRAGRDHCSFLGADEQWARKYAIELGFVEHGEIPRVLSLADFFVQPGLHNRPNDFWLPRKIPEFFAMGRPVILPRVGIGEFIEHGVNGWVLPKVDALGIVDAVKHLREDKTMTDKLSRAALVFYERNFDERMRAVALETMYRDRIESHLRSGEAANYPGPSSVLADAPSAPP